jgi:hypothetical protein
MISQLVLIILTLGNSWLLKGELQTATPVPNSVREQIIGTWKLVSTEDHMRDGTKRFYPDAGPNGKGFLIYTADGHMCAQLMNPDRPMPKDKDQLTIAEKISSYDGFSSYCGRYDVDESKGLIYHYPETALWPSFVGTKQRRPYKLQGDLLTFADRVSDEPGVESYSITWKRAEKF